MAGRRAESGLRIPDTNTVVDHYYPGDEDIGIVVWIRTPYGRKGMVSIARRFARAGAHVVVEELPGGDPTPSHQDAAKALVSWLAEQYWFPGAIASWGLSAIGYASWTLAEVEIPQWRLAILQDAESELRDAVLFPGGAFAGTVALSYVHSVEWFKRHPRGGLARSIVASMRAAHKVKRHLGELPLGKVDQRLVGHRVDYFQERLAHERDEEYWKRLDRRRNASGMPELVHLASGWYDVCLSSVLADYRALREAGKTIRLLVGPWYHGRGAMDQSYRADIDRWLLAAGHGTDVPDEPPVRVHVGGVGEWRNLADWPPPTASPVQWHLHPNGRLARTPAPERLAPARYRYDPAHPTPSVGGAGENLDGSAGAKDNRRLERRADVLTYTSDTLDADLETIGTVTATITLRASIEHIDVFVRLCDVAPDGRSLNLCEGIRRLRPVNPDTTGRRTVTVDLIGVAHRFRTGHRLRVQISGAAHPRFVRNTGTGAPLATTTILHPADVEIYPASHVVLPHAPTLHTTQ